MLQVAEMKGTAGKSEGERCVGKRRFVQDPKAQLAARAALAARGVDGLGSHLGSKVSFTGD